MVPDLDRPAETAEHPLGDPALLILGGPEVGAEQHELVTAQPADRVARPHHVLQPAGDDLEHFVAGLVAVRVVDVLEVVQVEEHDRDVEPGAH